MLKPVVVSKQAYASDDPYDLVFSNIQFVNLLMRQFVAADEMSPQAVQSYCVDYYLAQVNNGGFAQFLWNSHSIETDAARIAAGLLAMGAQRHLDLFNDSLARMESLGDERLEKFLGSELFGANPERDVLNSNNDAFYALADEEDLIDLNAAWLRSLPDLVVVDQADFEAESRRIADSIPAATRGARRAEAEDNVPEYHRAITALCAATGQTLDRITAGDPAHEYKGASCVAWHFLTDHGHFYYVQDAQELVMLDGERHAEIARIDLPWA